jgi:UDP-N-acetylmuramoylalanine--D-glutamate ligase
LPSSVLVVGLARSGRAAAAALARRGVRVVAADRSPDADPGRLVEAGVEVRLGTEDEALLDMVELVVKSPGVPAQAPQVAAARAGGVPVWSELELGFRLHEGNPILAVTGTNGKTTTAELLGSTLGAPVAGNEHRPLSELDNPEGWIVCEVSSFQLEDVVDFRPRVAVLVNLEPDHLDRHGTFEAYRAAKLRLFENQRAGDAAVLPRGFGDVPGTGLRIEFRSDDPLPAEPLIPGEHNRENAAAATAAARAAGIDDETIGRALSTFSGVPHRLELVAERDGVRWVNDSKATNVPAALRGLRAHDAPLRVILGGSLKGESFAPLAPELAARAASVYLIGRASDEIARALDDGGVAYERAGDLARAVRMARQAAEPGDVVLLSPACASYDQYRDFEQRGTHFRELVEALT